MGGLIGLLLSFTRSILPGGARVSDAKIDPGGGANTTAQHFSTPGDDSVPLPGDYVLAMPGQRAGTSNVVGYLEPKTEPVAGPGEKRIYARDALGAVVVEIHLKSSGEAIIFNSAVSMTLKSSGEATVSNSSASMTLSPAGSVKGANSSGSFELEAGGDFVVNGVTIDTSGNITTTGNGSFGASLIVATKELAGHIHLAGIPPGSTGPNT